jgi:hypothetical protein
MDNACENLNQGRENELQLHRHTGNCRHSARRFGKRCCDICAHCHHAYHWRVQAAVPQPSQPVAFVARPVKAEGARVDAD